MKGYLSFVLVFFSMLLLLSLIAVASEASSYSLSKAVAIERTYALQMNVKECIIESARQGAQEGFARYDLSHDVRMCRHCPDDYCVPQNPIIPNPPNPCDPLRCAQCFRESEARAEAELGAKAKISLLNSHIFDPDYSVSIAEPKAESFLKSDPLSKNGFGLDSMRLSELGFNVDSEKLGIRSASKIPKGTEVHYG